MAACSSTSAWHHATRTRPHRAATPLELFLDLAFVVAVAQAAPGCTTGWSTATPATRCRLPAGVLRHLVGLDELHLVRLGLRHRRRALPAGRLRADDRRADPGGRHPPGLRRPRLRRHDVGYVVMRLALVGQWLRVAASDPTSAGTAPALRRRHLASCRSAGCSRLLLPEALVRWPRSSCWPSPSWPCRSGPRRPAATPWHPHHIVERYGLFTIIVLGESVLAATFGVQAALDADSTFGDLAAVVVRRPAIVFSMWWVYFDLPAERMVEQARPEFDDHVAGAFVWGYGHYFVFGPCRGRGRRPGRRRRPGRPTTPSSPTCRPAWPSRFRWRSTSLAVWVLHYRAQAPGPAAHRTPRRSPSPCSSRPASPPNRSSSPASS